MSEKKKYEAEAQALDQFLMMCTECQTVFANKNFQYGNSIQDTGAVGAVVTLIGDTARLRNIVLGNIDLSKVDWEKSREVLLDIHNYAAIAMMMIDNNNLIGDNENES